MPTPSVPDSLADPIATSDEADDVAAPVGEPEPDAAAPAGIVPGLPLPLTQEIEPSAPAALAPELRSEIEKLNALAKEKLAQAEYQAAIDPLRRVLALASHSAAAHGNLAYALWRSKSAMQAEIHCRRAITINPDYLPAHRILTELLRDRAAPDALAAHHRLLDLDPDNFIAHNNMGLVLGKLGRRGEADAAFERALQLKPGNPWIRFNQLIVAQNENVAEAVDCCRRVLELSPDNPDVLTNLGITLQLSGRYAEALAAYERALAVDPRHLHARFNMSLLLLLQGRYARGFDAYEARRELREVPKPSFARPEWHGEDLAGKTVMLHSEQGLGDTIQCLRYVPLVAARGGRVVVRIERTLVRLAASLADKVVIAPTTAPLPAFDVWCLMLSLPRIFATRVESIPAATPYLGVRPVIAQRWQKRLERLRGRKVGLVWAGSAGHVNDFRRSIDLARLKPVLDVPGVSFVSLQVGPRAADLAQLPPGSIAHLSAALTDFAETAGAILNLDLVIAVDTAVAHLAGALGKPAWVMLPFLPDWRWLIDREDSPWYPTLRLYRQRRPGDWDEVIARVAADLAARAAAANASKQT